MIMRTLVHEIKKNWQSLKIGEKKFVQYSLSLAPFQRMKPLLLIEFFKEGMFLYFLYNFYFIQLG